MGFLGLGQKRAPQVVDYAAIEERKREEEASKASATAWLKQSQQSALTDAFSVMRNVITSIKPQKNWSDGSLSSYNVALDSFDNLRNHWLSIDRNLITNDEGNDLYQILNSYLPWFVDVFHKQTILNNAWEAWNYHKHYNYKNQYNQPLAGICLAMISEVTGIEQRIRVNKVIPPVVDSLKEMSTFRVPSTLIENDVRERIERISLLWQAAKAKANSVEDIYFLEQANSAYVPEAVKMYESFKLASPQVKDKAKEMLLEQLVLVEEEVSKILNNVMEDNLNAMQAQVNFLRAKTNKEITGTTAQLELTEVRI